MTRLRRTPRPWPPNAEPTDEQFAAWLEVCTHDERLEIVRRWRSQADRGFRCLIEDHEFRLSFLRDLSPGPGRHRAPDDDPTGIR